MTAAARCYELAIAACDKHWLSSADGEEAMVRRVRRIVRPCTCSSLCAPSLRAPRRAPSHHDAVSRTRLAKQSSDQGWQTYAALHRLPHVRNSTPPPSTNLAHGLACIQEGVALAEEVLVMAPHRARAHTGAALGLGRLALFVSDTRQRVALCNRIRREAETAVKLDPGDDAAHHVLGRWHMEVASLNPVVRLVMRHVYGGDIKASTTQALHHFNQARQIAPQRLAHAAELGKALMKLGRRKEAYETLKQALQCDIEARYVCSCAAPYVLTPMLWLREQDVNAAMGKMHVERMLKKLKKQDRQAVREERRCAPQMREWLWAGTLTLMCFIVPLQEQGPPAQG